jgi:uncharacterized protein
MKYLLLTVTMALFTVKMAIAQQENLTVPLTKQPFILGETIGLYSKLLQENRALNIYLPAGYHPDSLRTYPVVYLLDGSADEDFIHVVGIVQFGTFPWVDMMPESIVVGIANVDRKRDFTFPTTVEQDKKDFPTTGGSANFIRFLKEELKPFIEKNYQTSGVSTIVGQSLGGLLATEILFKQTEMFDNFIIVSPSIWWDDESLWTFLPKFKPANKSIYIAVGKKEHELMVKTAKRLGEELATQNVAGFRVHCNLLQNENHADIFHLALYHGFNWVFKQEGKKQ